MRTSNLFVFCLCLLSGAALAAPQSPNILFILCDDLGINDLHCYGRQDHRTPHLDRLAGQGTRFTSAYCAQPICSPSRAAILTGKTPARLHLTTFLPGRPDCPAQKVLHPEIPMQLPLSEKLLPRYFKEAGYATAAIGKWHVGGEGFGPREHGFDVYHPGQVNTTPSATEGGKGEYDLTLATERFIESNRDRPFLIYLAHDTPHIPYDAQSERIEGNSETFEPVYAAVIETLDDTVGRLMAKLEALKLATNTIVIFTSDNGGLHVPEWTHRRITHNTPYRAGKGFLFEDGLRVPLIVRWPGRVPAGRVLDSPVINTDWLPTLLDLAGQPLPTGLDGVSFAALLTGRAKAARRSLFWHFPHYTNQGSRPGAAVREGDWMLIESYDSDAVELYNLASDAEERRDLALQEASRVTAMRASLAAWRREVAAAGNRPNPDFDPAQFRALYLDVDASRFDPAEASMESWEAMWNWRKGMDAAPKAASVKPSVSNSKSPTESNSPARDKTSGLGSIPLELLGVTKKITVIEAFRPTPEFDRHDPSNIIRHGDRYWVFYTRNIGDHKEVTVHFASSSDGYRWTDLGEALGRGPKGSWDESGAIAPYCVHHDGKFYLFYTGFRDGNLATRELGIAIASHPSGSWTRWRANPILRRSSDPAAWDSGMLGDSNVIFREGKWWLYFKSRRDTETNAETRIGVAVADQITGPYRKHPANPLFAGHAFSAWRHRDGVAALCGAISPKIKWSPDGLHFLDAGEMSNHSTGLFSPHADTDREHLRGFDWGLEQYSETGPRGLRRFDCSPRAADPTPHSPH